MTSLDSLRHLTPETAQKNVDTTNQRRAQLLAHVTGISEEEIFSYLTGNTEALLSLVDFDTHAIIRQQIDLLQVHLRPPNYGDDAHLSNILDALDAIEPDEFHELYGTPDLRNSAIADQIGQVRSLFFTCINARLRSTPKAIHKSFEFQREKLVNHEEALQISISSLMHALEIDTELRTRSIRHKLGRLFRRAVHRIKKAIPRGALQEIQLVGPTDRRMSALRFFNTYMTPHFILNDVLNYPEIKKLLDQD